MTHPQDQWCPSCDCCAAVFRYQRTETDVAQNVHQCMNCGAYSYFPSTEQEETESMASEYSGIKVPLTERTAGTCRKVYRTKAHEAGSPAEVLVYAFGPTFGPNTGRKLIKAYVNIEIDDGANINANLSVRQARELARALIEAADAVEDADARAVFKGLYGQSNKKG